MYASVSMGDSHRDKHALSMACGTGTPGELTREQTEHVTDKNTACERRLHLEAGSSGSTGEIAHGLAQFTVHMRHDGGLADALKSRESHGPRVARSRSNRQQQDAQYGIHDLAFQLRVA